MSAALVLDGVARVGFNSIRLFAYCIGANDFGDALPSNGLGMIGKIGDMMSGTDFYEVGHGQAWASTANDLLLGITPYGTAGAVVGVVLSPRSPTTWLSLGTSYYIVYSHFQNINSIQKGQKNGR